MSSTFPVDALDSTMPEEERAERLTKQTLAGMLNRLLKARASDVPCRITMYVRQGVLYKLDLLMLVCSLNVCATNFTKAKPDQNIASVFARTSNGVRLKTKISEQEPSIIQLSSDEEESTGEPVILEDSDADDVKPTTALLQDDTAVILSSQDDDLVFVGEERPNVMSCKECGSRLFAFSAAAHMKFHEESRMQSSRRPAARSSLGSSKKAKPS